MKLQSKVATLFLAIFSLLVGYGSPTIQVVSSNPISGWDITHYEIEYRSQLVTAIVLSAVFMLIVLLLAKHTRRFDAITGYLLSWLVGGFIFVICQAEMFYLTLVAFGQPYPQSDVWYNIFSSEFVWNVTWAGLLIAIVSGVYKIYAKDPSSYTNKEKRQALSELSEMVNDVPSERLSKK